MEVELEDLLATIAAVAAAGADEPKNALEAEQWASGLVSSWRIPSMPDPEIDGLFWPGLVAELEDVGGTGGLAALRALASIGQDPYDRLAADAGDRLAARGVAEPSWGEDLGTAQPVAALLFCDDDGFDDGFSVIVEFATADRRTYTLGVYVDHNMGGLVKDVFVAGPLDGVRRELGRRGPTGETLVLREIDLAAARARVEDALRVLDDTIDPPVDGDVPRLRALIYARMRTLPEGAPIDAEFEEVTVEQRAELRAEFLGSTEGRRWAGSEGPEDVVGVAIDFGADYNHGGPLRWSPVVVEIFMVSWLARKVSRQPAFFELVPDVLLDWVAFAGRRRGVADAAVRHAVAAVGRYREEMLDAVADPDSWGPAKAFAAAAVAAGVDITDVDAVNEFIEHYNDGLAA